MANNATPTRYIKDNFGSIISGEQCPTCKGERQWFRRHRSGTMARHLCDRCERTGLINRLPATPSEVAYLARVHAKREVTRKAWELHVAPETHPLRMAYNQLNRISAVTAGNTDIQFLLILERAKNMLSLEAEMRGYTLAVTED